MPEKITNKREAPEKEKVQTVAEQREYTLPELNEDEKMKNRVDALKDIVNRIRDIKKDWKDDELSDALIVDSYKDLEGYLNKIHEVDQSSWGKISSKAKEMDDQVFNHEVSNEESQEIIFWKEVYPYVLKIENHPSQER